MEVRRTVSVKLDVSARDSVLLLKTIDQFLYAANYVIRQARNDDGYVITSRHRLHDRTYADVRESTDLHSNLVQAARNHAANALQSVISKWKQGKFASLPRFTSPFLDYDKRSATFHENYASLSTVGGRVTVEFILPSGDRETPHSTYLFSDDFDVTGATLHYRETTDEFYLNVRTKSVVDAPEPPENGTVLGVDLGVENIAVTSTGVFWSGAELAHWHREYQKRRASLQQRGTRYAHEAIQRVGETETGRFEQLIHQVANGIVREAVDTGCSHIAFENLTDIRDQIFGVEKLHAWAFRRLLGFVSYKAEVHGIVVDQVSPYRTSQRCSRSDCGFTDSANRLAQDSFKCQQCGYQLHADYNAAKNIGFNLLRTLHKSSDGDVPVGVRVNTGIVSVSGFTPAPSSVRA